MFWELIFLRVLPISREKIRNFIKYCDFSLNLFDCNSVLKLSFKRFSHEKFPTLRFRARGSLFTEFLVKISLAAFAINCSQSYEREQLFLSARSCWLAGCREHKLRDLHPGKAITRHGLTGFLPPEKPLNQKSSNKKINMKQLNVICTSVGSKTLAVFPQPVPCFQHSCLESSLRRKLTSGVNFCLIVVKCVNRYSSEWCDLYRTFFVSNCHQA